MAGDSLYIVSPGRGKGSHVTEISVSLRGRMSLTDMKNVRGEADLMDANN